MGLVAGEAIGEPAASAGTLGAMGDEVGTAFKVAELGREPPGLHAVADTGEFAPFCVDLERQLLELVLVVSQVF